MPNIIQQQRLREAAIVGLLFAASALWGTVYWNRSFQAGRQPQFYQAYFEPAVMFACGRGFLIAHPSVPAVEKFIEQKTDRLSCDEIPKSTGLSEYGLYQKTWLYLMLTVALTWKLLGVSWSGMGPLFGALFGATIVAAYGIFRVGMSRVVSAAGAAALAVSAVHLQNLPHLRDYAKAPFTLTLIWLLFLLVAGAPTWRRLLAVAAGYGAVLGIGYGFRTDFLVEIPVFFFVLFAFVCGGWLRNLPMKFAAATLCAAAFAGTAWPVVTAVHRSGGCQWHAALLGLTDPFNDSLLLEPGPYSFGHAYSDNLVYSMTTAFARRARPDVGHIEYCSPQYDAASGQYLAAIARTFPADMVTRTLSSIVQIAGVPFRWTSEPLPGFADRFFRLRRLMLWPLRGTGPVFVGLALAVLAAADLRIGLFGLFIVSYFGGYPMLQFGVRHYFHLEFLTWWALGFLVQQLANRMRQAAGVVRLQWRRAAAVFVVLAVTVAVTLLGVRRYQQQSAARLFQAYIDAPREAYATAAVESGAFYPTPIAHPAGMDPHPADVVEVEMNALRCTGQSAVRFRYREPQFEFTHAVALGGSVTAGGTTRIFEPVYAGFEGIDFQHAGPGCVTGVFRLSSPERLPLLLNVTLAANWQHDALYERLAAWKGAER